MDMMPCMNVELADSLSKRGIFSVQQLLYLPKATLQTMIENFPASKLYQDLQPFPRIKVKLKLQHKDSGKSRSLDITLVNTNFRQNKSRAFTPRFPKVKNEAWWLVLGNTSTWELYALIGVSFSDHLVIHMELPSVPRTLQVGDIISRFEKKGFYLKLDRSSLSKLETMRVLLTLQQHNPKHRW